MKYRKVTYKEFIRAIGRMPESLAPFLSAYTVEDYNKLKAECYLSDGNQSGYAVTGELDLISVFSLPGARQGVKAIKSAIDNGALTLDCMDGFLVGRYKSLGFVEVERLQWDDKFAPDKWDYERFGRPDIVLMKIN